MIAIDELKLNRFQFVSIPSNKDLFRHVGPRSPQTSVGSDEVIPMNMRTIDQLEYMDKYDSYMQRIEHESAGTDAESDGKSYDSSSNDSD